MPFNKHEIAVEIPPLQVGNPVPDTELIRKYRQYYGIDFENRIPDLQASLGRVDILDYAVVVHTFIPDSACATVWVVHGYYDHVGIYDHLIEYLLRQGYAVISFDLPGHGLTTGHLVAVPDFHRYQVVLKTLLETLHQRLPQPWFAVGQSTGSAILIDYLVSLTDLALTNAFRGVVLLAPLIRPRNWRTNRLLHALMGRFRDYVPRRFTISSGDRTFLHFLRERDPLQSRMLSAQWVGALKKWIPMIEAHARLPFSPLIIQGQRDGTVDWRHNVGVLRDLMHEPEVVYFPDLHHQVVNEKAGIRDEVFRQVVRHFRENAKCDYPLYS
jgi:lysophospholipase